MFDESKLQSALEELREELDRLAEPKCRRGHSKRVYGRSSGHCRACDRDYDATYRRAYSKFKNKLKRQIASKKIRIEELEELLNGNKEN